MKFDEYLQPVFNFVEKYHLFIIFSNINNIVPSSEAIWLIEYFFIIFDFLLNANVLADILNLKLLTFKIRYNILNRTLLLNLSNVI